MKFNNVNTVANPVDIFTKHIEAYKIERTNSSVDMPEWPHA